MTDPSEVEKLHRIIFELREKDGELRNALRSAALLLVGLAGHLQDRPESAQMLAHCRSAALGICDIIKEGKVTT